VKSTKERNPGWEDSTCLSSYKMSNQLHPAIQEKKLLSKTSSSIDNVASNCNDIDKYIAVL
jgi:hypothetical protein